MIGNNITTCKRCIMDSAVPGIRFDYNGLCNYCAEFDENINFFRFTATESENRLKLIATKIKNAAKGKEYDSIIGLSGGVDSSYAAFVAHKLGLNPLAIHFDNGWNSEVAVSNIKKIVDKCGFDLETYVINWPEFRDLQRSFFKASVVDIEMVTDHAIFAAMFYYAKKYGIKYILSGANFSTENGMPSGWAWRKTDIVNIRDIHNRFGTLKLKSFPVMGSFKFAFIQKFGLGFEFVELLNNLNYRKDHAIETLHREFDWQYYGGKHYESVFTKFYQGYVLPVKFKIDKRIMHFSSLIRNGEIFRQDALNEIIKPVYTEAELKSDKDYVLKKLGFSEQEFEAIMTSPPVSHLFYDSDQEFVDMYTKFYKTWRKKLFKR